MFKWPDAPSPRADVHELADFVELLAWQDATMSVVELSRLLGRMDEVDYSDGVQEEEDELGVSSEMERRRAACSGSYPFVVDNSGQSVRFELECGNARHLIYLFLLLATRLNMSEDRRHGGFDGTELFEELGAEAARCYLGARAKSMVFGTAADAAGFAEKVDDLCRRIGEGDGFIDRHGGGQGAKDDKLDIVAWIPFADRQYSKVILFGQCKTGTHFRNHLTELQPGAFCDSWWRSPPSLTPTRTFFVAEGLPSVGWGRVASKAGLLFDRCRIVDFCETVSVGLLEKLGIWTREAGLAARLPAVL